MNASVFSEIIQNSQKITYLSFRSFSSYWTANFFAFHENNQTHREYGNQSYFPIDRKSLFYRK